MPQVLAIAQQSFDAVINLCDGAWDEDRAGVEVVQTLQRCGVAYTGASADHYDPSRDTMKRVLHYSGLATPRHVFCDSDQDSDDAARHLRFPLIVKHPASYGSIALDRGSVCTTAAQLHARTAAIRLQYGQALVEEFVAGREFTVLVAESETPGGEPRTWPAVEFSFPPGESFKHFDLKWVQFAQMGSAIVPSGALADRLRTAAATFFAALGGDGYGRVDFRMATDGTLHILEINPNCGVFYPAGSYGSADFALAAAPGGHRAFLDHILRCALARRDRSLPATRVRFDVLRNSYGLFAARALPQGSVVQAGEGQAHFLVSQQHVADCWPLQQRKWFAQYAWPLTDQLHVAWSPRPEDWQPLDHSCDPNTWLHGLDLVARRNIARGEAITADYATFCGPAMASFACACGAAGCRRTITAADHLLPELGPVYAGHFSDFVARARVSAGLSA